MNDFRDLKSALHSGTEHILTLPQPPHVWNYIQDHLEITPQTVTWKVWGKNDPVSLRAPSSEGWILSIGSLVLATGLTFDLVRCSHEWSTVPALEVLPLWISWVDGALKRGEITQEDLDAPLVAIEAKKDWLHGKISDSDLQTARDAAYRAARDAAHAAYRAAHAGAAYRAAYAADTAAHAAYKAASAAAAGAYDAAGASWNAARDAAHTASWDAAYDAGADATAYAAARSAAWERYNEEFCQYVLDSIMNETR